MIQNYIQTYRDTEYDGIQYDVTKCDDVSIFLVKMATKIAILFCKLDSCHSIYIYPSSPWWTRDNAERMKRYTQKMIPKLHFYHHWAWNELTSIFLVKMTTKIALLFCEFELDSHTCNQNFPSPSQHMGPSAEEMGRNAQKQIATHHFYHRLPLATLKQFDFRVWKFGNSRTQIKIQ